MGVRWRMSQVSVNEVRRVRLESLKSVRKTCPNGAPNFPFIDQGKGPGYTRERKKEKKKEKRQRRRES
jgi:hypothetical protein